MYGESLITYLSGLTVLSPAFTSELYRSLIPEHYKPHQVIHAGGQVEERFWFVESGFARSYYFDPAGKEHTLSFYVEKEFVFSYKGFWKESTDYYIEVLAPSTLLSVSYTSLNRLLEQYGEAHTLMRMVIRLRYDQDLFKSRLMTWTAEERYRQFRKARPDIFRIASVRLIATFLNMTRENLSRLMARKAR